MSEVAIVAAVAAYVILLVAVGYCGYHRIHIPVFTPASRLLRRVTGRLGGDWLNQKIWAWQDRRRAERLLPLAAMLETRGMKKQAEELRYLARPGR